MSILFPLKSIGDVETVISVIVPQPPVPVALVVPEYGLLLDSPLHGDMDMHAFGNGDRALKGLWHLVMVEATAIRAEQYKLEPDGRDCYPWCHQDT